LTSDSDQPISTEPHSPSISDVNPNPKKRKCSTGSDKLSKRRQLLRKTTVKQHLADEINHSSQWLAGIEQSINDCKADLVAVRERETRFLAEIKEEREKVTLRKNEFIKLKNSIVA
jgi:hypothetical protein